MGTCEVCGNEYDMAFEVVAAGARHEFDSFAERHEGLREVVWVKRGS